MPPCQPVKPVPGLDGGAEARPPLALDRRHRHALHDEVGFGHRRGIRVDGR